MSTVVEGSWVVTLAVVEPGNTATIPVTLDQFGATEPQWNWGEGALHLWWADGRRVIFSSAGMLQAEYTPPVRAASNQDTKGSDA